jgi:PST family polysaccharide transporter
MSNYKQLVSNFISLSTVQIAEYILPLITVPYLVRVLGPEKFGLIAFSQAFIQYFVLVTDYGFNYSATREISIHREDRKRMSEIFCTVMAIKTAFMISSFIILCILILTISKFSSESVIYLFTFGTAIGNVVFPIWLFQGIERMKTIAIASIVSKFFFTVSVFIFIRAQADYVYVPLLNSLGIILSGIISLWVVVAKLRLSITFPSVTMIKHELKEGWNVFLSTVAINLYTTSNTVILGLFSNNTIVGYYSAGDRLVKASLGLLIPLSQTIYPYVSKLASESKEIALSFIKNIIKLTGLVTLFISAVLFLAAPQISNVVLGIQFKESIPVIRIFALLPFLVSMSNIFGIQVMLNFGLKKAFTKILVFSGVVNILMSLILVRSYLHIGIAISVLLTEAIVTCSMLIVLHQNGLSVMPVRQKIESI